MVGLINGMLEIIGFSGMCTRIKTLSQLWSELSVVSIQYWKEAATVTHLLCICQVEPKL